MGVSLGSLENRHQVNFYFPTPPLVGATDDLRKMCPRVRSRLFDYKHYLIRKVEGRGGPPRGRFFVNRPLFRHLVPEPPLTRTQAYPTSTPILKNGGISERARKKEWNTPLASATSPVVWSPPAYSLGSDGGLRCRGREDLQNRPFCRPRPRRRFPVQLHARLAVDVALQERDGSSVTFYSHPAKASLAYQERAARP